MKKRAKQSHTIDPTPSTKAGHTRVVGLLVQSTRNVVCAADLASLGVALAEVLVTTFGVAEEHGLELGPIFDAVLKSRDRAVDVIAKQCKDHLLPYTRFPYVRAGSGEVATTIVRYAVRHPEFNVDDLLRLKKLSAIYGEEREGRKKLVAILHGMAKEKVLQLVSPGEMGPLGKPATYKINYE